jgi:hypothetical protein
LLTCVDDEGLGNGEVPAVHFPDGRVLLRQRVARVVMVAKDCKDMSLKRISTLNCFSVIEM